MLAQSLFQTLPAPAAPAAQAGAEAGRALDSGATGSMSFESLLDRQGSAEGVSPELPSTKDTAKPMDWAGPQILPGAEALEDAVPSGPVRPEVLPPEETAPSRLVKPSIPGPQILPDAEAPGGDATSLPEPEPKVPAAVGKFDPARPEVLPPSVGPEDPATGEDVSAPVPAVAAAHGPAGAATASSSAPQTTATPAPTPHPAPQPGPGLQADRAADGGEPAPGAQAGEKPAAVPSPVPHSGPAEGGPASARPPVEAAKAALAPVEPVRQDQGGQVAGPEPVAVSETPSSVAAQPGFGLSRVAHQTLAELSAQIVRRLEGRSTRFEMALTPDDLGRVDVRLEVAEDGSLTARLAFDTPAAAAELRAQADQLRRQLEQAGFQLARDALEFSHRDGSSSRQDGFERRSGRAFAAARDLTERVEAQPIHLSLSLNPARERLDVKV